MARATDEFRQAGLRMAKFVSGTGVVYTPSILVSETVQIRDTAASSIRIGSVGGVSLCKLQLLSLGLREMAS